MAIRNFHLASFPASKLGLVVRPYGNGPTIRERLTAEEVFAQDPTVQLLIDGPMWADGDLLRFRYLDTSQGLNLQGHERDGRDNTGWGATLSVVDGVASMRSGNEVAPGATVAVQGYPELVRNGVEVHTAGVDEGSSWRAAVGILANGEVFFAVGVGGNEDFALALQEAGAVDAVYLDGGSSTTMQLRGEPRIGDTSARGNKAVGSWVVARGASPEDLAHDLAAQGSKALARVVLGTGAALVVAGLATGGVLLWRARRAKGTKARKR